ncbi:MAG: 2-C-methyl-D-erythritol 4-phosphate cytidylyltransferase [Pseudomonadota bacterium]|nr:2-C-methyl-D-erythritol 4-phosphate cytidylyltransferase [Pseudomonadota bacterium]
MSVTPAASRVWAIVPAAGSGRRFNSTAAEIKPKQYAALSGATVLEWSLRALLDEPKIHAVVVVLANGDAHWPALAAKLNHPKLRTATGGANRQESVMNGLESLSAQAAPTDWALVHDAARPCFNAADLRSLLDALEPRAGTGHAASADVVLAGAVLAVPVVDTVKRELGGHVSTVDRQGLWRALTPQVFGFEQLRHALREARSAGITVTDESQAMERMGMRPVMVVGSPFNVKVTGAEDLAVAERILKMTQDSAMRVGQGFDAHAFGAGDHVVLAGVSIAYPKGIVAHSDGDVIIHALCDAVLGALGDGDIGQHFPDTDARYRGADSRVFLRVVAERMRAAGYHLVNADVTVLAEAPRINVHRAAMAANLAADLGVPAKLINIKATTTERMGFIGRGEGLAAMACVLLRS